MHTVVKDHDSTLCVEFLTQLPPGRHFEDVINGPMDNKVALVQLIISQHWFR